MPRRARLSILTFILMLLVGFVNAPARAGLIATVSVDIVPETAGMSLYTYTVSVSSQRRARPPSRNST